MSKKTPTLLLALLPLVAAPLVAGSAGSLERRPAAPEDPMQQDADRVLRESTPAAIENARVRRELGARRALPARAAGTYSCIPSCDGTDGRFLVIANGASFRTLSDPVLRVHLAAPAGTAEFPIEVFDGDARELVGGVTNRWDSGAGPALFEYRLYADPLADGSGTTVVPLTASSPTVLSDSLPNDAWASWTIATGPEARSASGHYFYILEIELLETSKLVLNAFKIRTTQRVSLESSDLPFSFVVNFGSLEDALTLWPSYPATLPTSYDGSFRFFFHASTPQTELAIWDGDLDRGKFDLTDQDTDDPDTPNAPFVPDFATVDTVPEGVAVGTGGSTGSPSDDLSPAASLGTHKVRSPSVRYDVVFPDGRVFANENPSGNQEWEQFRIGTEPFDRATMDYTASSIPAGIYELRLEGVDAQNLNALRLPFRMLGVGEDGEPREPLLPILVGDTVFADLDGDGVQDGAEPGIEGVVVELRTGDGQLISTATTDSDGLYSFEVDPGTYTVAVATGNFSAGGPLAGAASTTGDERTASVVDANDLDYDFGYRLVGSIGDSVWHDRNENGVQDTSEASDGLPGIDLSLTEAGPDGVLGTGDDVAFGWTDTDSSGIYGFGDLPAGTYLVDVDEATLPANFVSTTFNEPMTVGLGAGDHFLDADFGYAACGDCKGKATRLVLRYRGAKPVHLVVTARRGSNKNDEVFSGVVSPGGLVDLVGPLTGNGGFYGTLGTEIRFWIAGSLHAALHTSCSVPLGPGTVAGDFVVLGGASRHGGPLCSVK